MKKKKGWSALRIRPFPAIYLLAVGLFAAAPMSFVCAASSSGEDTAEYAVPLYQGLKGYGLCIDPALECPVELKTAEDFQNALAYMALYELDTLNLSYQSTPPEGFLSEVRRMSADELYTYRYAHPEYFNYMNLVCFQEVRPAKDGSYGLGIRLYASGYDSDTMIAYRHQAFLDAQEVLQELYDAGKLRQGMSERKRARILTRWIVDHTEYNNDETRLCHTAWSVFRRGRAVCDGYVSALQLMLSLDGIQCRGQLGTVRESGILHLWTIAVLDGKEVGIDPIGCETDFRYFGMDGTEMDKCYIFKGQEG